MPASLERLITVRDRFATGLRIYLQACIGLPNQNVPSYMGTRLLTDLFVPPDILPVETAQTSHERVAWTPAWASRKRAVVLGQPGMGKTLLMRMTVRSLAETSLTAVTTQQQYARDVAIPLYLRLWDIAEEGSLEASAAASIRTMLASADAQTKDAALVEAVVQHVRHVLFTDRCFLFLDALDEVPARAKLRRALEPLRHAECHVVVSSRPRGYDRSLLPFSSVSESALAPFTPKQRQQFVRNWFRADVVRRERILAFLQNHPQFDTALLLTLCCASTAWRSHLSAQIQPADLYREGINTLLMGHKKPEELLVLLQKAAWSLFRSHPSSTIYRYATLRNAMLTAQHQLEMANDVSTLNAELQDTGLLVFPSTDQAMFVHPLFRDFLAAEYCASRSKSFAYGVVLRFFWRPEAADMLHFLTSSLPIPRLFRLLQRLQRFGRRQVLCSLVVGVLVILAISWLLPLRHVMRGNRFFHQSHLQGNIEQAVVAYRTAMENMQGPLRWWQQTLVANHLLLAQGYQALAQKQWPQAVPFFEQLRQQFQPQRKSQGYAGLAAVALARGDAQRARLLLQQAEVYDPDNISSHVIRGHIFLHEGNFEAAAQAYRIATGKTNGMPWQRAVAANHLVLVQGYQALAQEQWPQAAPFFEQLQQQPQPPYKSEGYAGLAATALAQGEPQRARLLLQQAEAYDPDNISSHVVRGHVLFYEFLQGLDAQKRQEAEQAYRTAIDGSKTGDPPWQRAIALHRLGRIYAARGFAGTALRYYDAALEDYDKAPSLRQHMAMVYANKAYLLAESGEMKTLESGSTDTFNEAIALYEEALQRNPDDDFIKTLRNGVRQWRQSTLDAHKVEELLSTPDTCGKFTTHGDGWTSTPLFLALHTFQRQGSFAFRAGEGDFLLYRVLRLFAESGRVRILERALQDNCFAAALLVTGSISRSQTDKIYQEELSISLIDTQDGNIQAEAKHAWLPGAFRDVAEELSGNLLRQVRHAYPLRGRIIGVSPEDVMVNIGTEQGVTRGLIMQVVDIADGKAEIEVTLVKGHYAHAKILQRRIAFQEGWKVQEVRQP